MDCLAAKILALVAEHGSEVLLYRESRVLWFRWQRHDGWLWFDDCQTYWTVWLLRSGEPMVAADICKETGELYQGLGMGMGLGITGAWARVVTATRPIPDERAARMIYEHVCQAIEGAD